MGKVLIQAGCLPFRNPICVLHGTLAPKHQFVTHFTKMDQMSQVCLLIILINKYITLKNKKNNHILQWHNITAQYAGRDWDLSSSPRVNLCFCRALTFSI